MPQKKISHIGLIAGDKNLPFLVLDYAKKHNKKISVMGIEGCVSKKLSKLLPQENYREFHLSQLSKTIKFFKSQKVDTIVIVGGVNNSSIKINFDVIRIFSKLLFMKNKYDSILRLIIREFEKHNFNVVGIHEIMPELLIENKVLTDVLPSSKDIDDAQFGFEQALNFANTDKGQSIIVKNKEVIATEKFSGTDDLIRRASKLTTGKGGILIKVLKPTQEIRADIPVLGVNTIKELSSAGFFGVVIEANKSIIENREEVISLANKLGIFIMGSDGNFS